jgi:hypothetical protein
MGAASCRVYAVELTRVAVTGAITLIQIKAAATVPLQILRVEVGQSSSTTSTQQPIQLNLKSAAASVTGFTPVKQGPSTDPAASAVAGGSATGINASVEGTDGSILRQGVFNYLQGYQFLPTPKEYPFIDAGGIFAVKLPVAPGASVTLTADAVFEELA